jgi:hypothetical protein
MTEDADWPVVLIDKLLVRHQASSALFGPFDFCTYERSGGKPEGQTCCVVEK